MRKRCRQWTAPSSLGGNWVSRPGPGEITQSIKCLPHKGENLSLDPQNPWKMPGTMNNTNLFIWLVHTSPRKFTTLWKRQWRAHGEQDHTLPSVVLCLDMRSTGLYLNLSIPWVSKDQLWGRGTRYPPTYGTIEQIPFSAFNYYFAALIDCLRTSGLIWILGAACVPRREGVFKYCYKRLSSGLYMNFRRSCTPTLIQSHEQLPCTQEASYAHADARMSHMKKPRHPMSVSRNLSVL